MVRRILFFLACLLFCHSADAQFFGQPVIGAQVFVEPGQTAEDIDEFFSILERNHMKVARIRLFGAHIFRGDNPDYSLYDAAFDAAERHGVKIFATLFPTTDELHDVGGFKFPHSKQHLQEIDEYVRNVVKHFKDHPALSVWVLQNEPGFKAFRFTDTDLSDEVKAQWLKSLPKTDYDNGFLKADFENERFVTYYTLWYLKHIADIVIAEDPVHGRHVNPFQIMGYMSAHDYDGYESILTSLGLSMHYASHFAIFNENEYTMATSLMNDIIRSGARSNPYWVTEIQAGNVMASGRTPYCPPGNHVSQYLWTSLARGAKGIMFWTLNPRAAVQEAGEWGLIDYLRGDTDRLLAARKVALALEEHGDQIEKMKPVSAPITILYSHESFYVERFNARTYPSDKEARKIDCVEKALSTVYAAISANGVCPEVCELKAFDWNNAQGRVAVLPDCLVVPSKYWNKIREFVDAGGKLIITGRSMYYDENMFCVPMYRPFPLADCFGAELKEYKATADYFPIGDNLIGHLWRGVIKPNGAEVILSKSGEVLGSRNQYGKGSVVWVPTPIELGAYHQDMSGLEAFYTKECKDAIEVTPIRLVKPVNGIVLAALKSETSALVVITNKTGDKKTVKLMMPFKEAEIIDGNGKINGHSVSLAADDFVALICK